MIISRNQTSATIRLRRDRARARAIRTGIQAFADDARRLDVELIRRELASGRLF
jgi:hypothetical protein